MIKDPLLLAEKKKYTETRHGIVREDVYHWLQDPNDPEVIRYIEAENEHYLKQAGSLSGLEEKTYNESMGRIVFPIQKSLPYLNNGYWYYFTYVAGKKFPLQFRCRNIVTREDQELLLDANEITGDSKYFYVAPLNPSPDNRYVLVLTDRVGDVRFSIQVKDLHTNTFLPHGVPAGVSSYLAWANTSRAFYYVKRDKTENGNRLFEVYLHQLDTPADQDQLIYREEDRKFSLSLRQSKQERYIFIDSRSRTTAETLLIDQEAPHPEPFVFAPRKDRTIYAVEHTGGDNFVVLTNYGAPNFRIMKTRNARGDQRDWEAFIPESDTTAVMNVEILDDFLALEEMDNGRMGIKVVEIETGEAHKIPFNDQHVTVRLAKNMSYEGNMLLFEYTSFRKPLVQCTYNIRERELKVLEERGVSGGYDPEDYVEESIQVIAPDGVAVPVSIVYKKGFVKDGSMPLLLVAYGAYGKPMEPGFSYTRVSLLDRGFAFAHAHVRGGNELGHKWHEGGRLLNKKNSISDYIACAEHLIREKYTSPQHLYGTGSSAGGIVIGGAVNERPELFNGLIFHNAFLDVLNAMLQESTPLTAIEYEEWGDPADPAFYTYIAGYAPYENVKKQPYPNMLVLAGLLDHLVPYYEAVKWVASIKEHNTADTEIYLHCDMNSGHFQRSGSIDHIRDFTSIIAYLLYLEGIEK